MFDIGTRQLKEDDRAVVGGLEIIGRGGEGVVGGEDVPLSGLCGSEYVGGGSIGGQLEFVGSMDLMAVATEGVGDGR